MLDICREFFSYLNKNGVRYCHWKSTIRLPESLNGKTDLDLLVHQNDKQSFNEALGRFEFKKILSPQWKRYPGMEDYIGLDQSTTELIHLHVHYKLVLGEKHIKGHHLKREEYILNTRVFVDTVPVPQPEVELLLAIIRMHMKSEISEIALNHLKRSLRPARPPYSTAVWEELVFLVRRTSPEIFRKALQEMNLPVSEQLLMDYLEKLSQSTITSSDILRIRQHIFERFRPFKRISPVHYSARKAFIKLRTLPFIPSLKNKKVLPGTGSVIALVGADGSGKSTLVKDIQSWLSWKLCVPTVYFGIPESMAITCVRNANRVLAIVEKYLPWKRVKRSLQHIVRKIDALRWIFIARKRLALFKKSRKLASAGCVVITDRYPLALFKSMDQPMDGPRLQPHTSYMPFLVNLEKNIYDQIGPPDWLFVLQADFPVLRKRKDNLDEQQHMKKVKAVNAIKPSDFIVPIDVNRPYQSVLMDLKRKIWRLL